MDDFVEESKTLLVLCSKITTSRTPRNIEINTIDIMNIKNKHMFLSGSNVHPHIGITDKPHYTDCLCAW